MKKKGLLIGLLLMAVGFAAVTTTLVINGTSILKKNTDDFKVYYSDALVNGTQDLSVVVDDTHLSFKTTLDTLGQTYVLDYDVTNSSKNYDAKLTMNCTGGNEYLTVVNSFNTTDNLLATETRRGKLTLTLAKSYTGNDLDVEIECTIDADAIERNSVATGTPASPAERPYEPGKVYEIEEEEFFVLAAPEDKVVLMAKNPIGDGTRQSEYPYYMFAYEIYRNTYLDDYEDFLENALGVDVGLRLPNLNDLENLGCTYYEEPNSYLRTERITCVNSPEADWLYEYNFWLADTVDSGLFNWVLIEDGIGYPTYSDPNGDESTIRPVITILKDDFESYLSKELILNANAYCNAKGHDYGMLYYDGFIITESGVAYEDGEIELSKYLCSPNEDFTGQVYGYDSNGNLVYEYDRFNGEQGNDPGDSE